MSMGGDNTEDDRTDFMVLSCGHFIWDMEFHAGNRSRPRWPHHILVTVYPVPLKEAFGIL